MASKARVLAVDDQLYFRTFIEGLLREESYEVETACDGSSALERLESEDGPGFDLVLSDLIMPGTKGVELVGTIRERWPELPVIVLSGVGDVNAVVGAMRNGAADYLLKPIHRERLCHAIEAVLERQRMQRENARLVDENLQMLGTLSLFERALPILEETNLDRVAEALLALIQREFAATSGLLWQRESLGSPLALRAGLGDLPFDDGASVWTSDRTESAEDLRAIELGEAVCSSSDRLFVPCIRDGALLGVAELYGRTSGSLEPGEREVAIRLGRLGAIALWNASRIGAASSLALREPRTGLPGMSYLAEILETEIHKAQRYGRGFSLLCVELRALGPMGAMQRVQSAVQVASVGVRTTDVLCAEDPLCFWILANDTDTLGGLVLKRRLAERIRDVLGASRGATEPAPPADLPAIGVASYPVDAEAASGLLDLARQRSQDEHSSSVFALGLSSESPLNEIAERVLEQAPRMPGSFVLDALDVVLGELRCRPRDRALLFLAPGPEREGFLAPLDAFDEGDSGTDVFLAAPGASPGEDAPRRPLGPAITPVGLPRGLSSETSWIVRLGEAPDYLLVAGPPDADGKRLVHHSTDPMLVEYVAFKLRADVGFGVEA